MGEEITPPAGSGLRDYAAGVGIDSAFSGPAITLAYR